MKSFEVLNALVTLTFATNRGGRGVGAWRIMGRKGYVRRERKDWEVAMGVINGRGGEKMGKLCNNTQYFVIEKRVGGGKPRKKVRELAALDPLSSKSVTMSKKSSMITT